MERKGSQAFVSTNGSPGAYVCVACVRVLCVCVKEKGDRMQAVKFLASDKDGQVANLPHNTCRHNTHLHTHAHVSTPAVHSPAVHSPYTLSEAGSHAGGFHYYYLLKLHECVCVCVAMCASLNPPACVQSVLGMIHLHTHV